jgi:hypothetical protein
VKTKICPADGCPARRKPQPLAAFARALSRPDGRKSFCLPCDRAYQKRQRAETKARNIAARGGEMGPAKRYYRPLHAARYLITAAQNATPVHAGFFQALKTAAKHLGAELVVIPLRYKNPTSRWTDSQEGEERWSPELMPYLFNVRKKLGPNLILAADVKTQPTAASPLSGFESLTGAESCIIGHTKMQFRAVPVPSGRFPKILTTTGAVTVTNYTDSKAGKLGAFHHFLGAVLVEISGRRFHLRQLNASRSDGSFIDLETLYTAHGVKHAPPALGLVMGDTHARFTDPRVDRATFGPGGIVETLDPAALIWHDLLDGYARNPHHAGDPFIAAAKMASGLGNVRAEVEHAIEFVSARTRGRESVIVASNHDNFLQRWVIADDWKRDPANAAFYLETAAAMLRSVKMTGHGTEYADPFAYWVGRLRGKARVRCLGADESYKLGDVECGMHGHQGPNGARGSIKNLARLGTRVISGHGHTPGIEEGHYRTGTSTPLRLEYTHGPGSWLNTHCAVYANGRRSLITIIDGEWRRPR